MYSQGLTSEKHHQAENETGSLLSAHGHPDSSRESDESLDIHSPICRQSRWREHVIRGAIAIFSITVGIAAGCYLTRSSSNSNEPTLKDFGINPKTPLPREIFTDRRDVPFIAHKEFIGPSKEADRNWDRITIGSDSIYLPDPSAYGLQDPGIRAPFFMFNTPPSSAASLTNLNNFYVLNTMHQLHCVNVARQRYNQLVYKGINALSGSFVDDDWLEHLEHCFEYLRLSIMCADYMTLESDSPPGSPEEYTKGNLGWGVVHSCINWDRLMEYQREMVGVYNGTWDGSNGP
ncbi:hypothetical protein SMACR_07667 [Sordaria macrospora]|uniref:WGS project CABT00000000 data, contig 2.27 n=2 Tax=Sordaria macrospora TaxID=5147 RepID=F7W4I2_SORMK|nr:uncharacterized protein SMAC_07667 [Sordaria macrospora k-hell]KAA8624048.1 hypothetical protein SMACR_07667 [Sordaria macrospora]KAH7635512.1 hypothetical protein B0T09DRAFT_353970 [Sordaria sp. MPI-SDFR-AT-0083]WPJ67442.1 hypothetical protein SMAC4_07667 [Sordaria macrospora]CCC14935.1 unnamed protein product [Sordaria macrospora k-hell]